MSDTERLLEVWRRLEAAPRELVLELANDLLDWQQQRGTKHQPTDQP